jgi:hypothetical protein
MRWELDPDFALHSRLSFGRSTWRWLILAIVGSVVAGFVVPNIRLQGIFAIIGLTLLAIAPPYGALHVISLERSHHLDLRRLTGRSSLAWMLASVFGTSWLVVVLAVPLLLGSRHIGLGVIEPLAVLLIGMTVALVLLSTPGLHEVDGRMLFALVLVVAFGTTVAGWRAPEHPALALIGAAAASGAALPAALSQMRRRRSVRIRSVRNPLRGLVRLSHSQLPEFSRSVLMAGPSVVGAGIFGLPIAIGAGLRAWNEWPRVDPVAWSAPLAALAYVPLGIAALGCSSQARIERTSGGLDRIRLTAQRPWLVVCQMAAGDAVPLVLLSLLCVGTIGLVHPSSPAVRPWPAVAALGLFAGLAEGLRGRKLGTYVLPAAAICALWYRQGASWWPLLLTALLPAAAAAACLAGPARRSSRWNPA